MVLTIAVAKEIMALASMNGTYPSRWAISSKNGIMYQTNRTTVNSMACLDYSFRAPKTCGKLSFIFLYNKNKL